MAKIREVRIAYTGGGSGGHVFPLLAVASEVATLLSGQGRLFRSFYFGDAGQYGSYFAQDHFVIKHIASAKVRRYFSLLNVVDFFKIPIAFVQAFWHIFWVMPDTLFSKGGTSSVPVVFAAWFFRVPVFVHESDSIPGFSNSFSAHFAKRVGVSFEKALEYFPKDGSVALVGNPVRRVLLEGADISPTQAKKVFGFGEDMPLVVVLGGSQGSARINDFFLDIISDLISKYQVLHQAGADNFEAFKAELAVASESFIPEQRSRYKAVNFLGPAEMKDALVAADVVVSRAGSGAIFEIAAMGRPSILIPLKESARNHQFFNAYEYTHNGACVVIEEDNLSSAVFLEQLELLLSSSQKLLTMGERAHAFAKPDAAVVIAQEMLNLAGRG